MVKNNLTSRLKNSLLTGLLAGYLGLAGCGGNGSPPEPPKPSISQTVSLVNDVDIDYRATLQNLNSATRTITHGTQMYSTTILYSPYNERLENREKGIWGFELKSGNLSDTDSKTIPNYDPASDFSSLETNLNERYEGSSKTFNLEALLSEKNPEDRPVPLTSAKTLSGDVITERISDYKIKVTATGEPGPYQVEVNFGSDEGGRSSSIIEGEILEVPDQIAFTRFRDNNFDIYIGDLVNNELINIQRLTEDSLQDFQPAWSPDGEIIAFTTNREDTNNDGMRDDSIYVMNADGSGQRRITPDNIEAMQADWCSNGKIASSSFGIATINEDGSGFTKLVEEPIGALLPGWPSWSPDCSKLAFMTHRDNNWEIYTMDANGSNQRNITNNLSLDQQPKWSPNGEKIAFTTDRDTIGQVGQFNLYLMNPDGTGLERLTDFSGAEYDLSWFFDSNRFAFTRETSIGEPLHIYMMNRDGSGLVQLTTEGQNFYPAWRPR